MAAVGPLLDLIRQDLHFTFSELSLLTTIPVFCIGFGIFISQQLLKYFHPFKLIIFALVIIGIADASRAFAHLYIHNLIFTAIIAGCGIATIQCIIPYVIKKNFPDYVAFYMGIYINAIMAGAALSAALVPLIEHYLQSWSLTLAFWSFLALIAILSCFSIRSFLTPLHSDQQQQFNFSFFKLPRAWLLCIYFGLGTASYTCVLAWLIPYFMDLGWSNTAAGVLLIILTTSEIVSGLFFPIISQKNQDRRTILLIILSCCLLGYSGIIFMPNILTILWICLLGLGIGGLFPMSLILTIDHLPSAEQAGQLSTFVQGNGYIIAAFSPFIAGVLRDQTQSFVLAWSVLFFTSFILVFITLLFNPKNYQYKML